ncbi:hypothetical protein IDM33_12545 [Acinetobacter seifertii]|nr:hypothetical protein [Acinetobacter seifertii]
MQADSTTGAVSAPTYVTTKTDGTTVNASNVGDALTNLNNEVVKPITLRVTAAVLTVSWVKP